MKTKGEFKGTKGEWVVVKQPNDNDFGIVKIGEYELSGQVFYNPKYEPEDFAEEQANLSLIAASPDMFKALKACAFDLRARGWTDEYPLLADALAALNKALTTTDKI